MPPRLLGTSVSGSRYTNWYHLKTQGPDRPDLIDVGKKMLGYLDNQRRLSGVPSLSIARKMADGSIVRARFIMDQPVIEIFTAAAVAAQPPTPDLLDGFVVLPAEAIGESEVVLTPLEGGRWQVWFYDATYVPINYPGSPRFYGTTFPAPDALNNRGRVDWSNQAQTLRVEWDGPTSRYFWSGSLSSRVYYKGAVLLDVSLIEGGLVGRTGGQVCGACITRDADGHLLIVAIRYGSEQGTGTSRRDVFLAVPLAVDAVHFVPGAKFEQQPKLQAVTAEAILLLDQERGANVDDYRHPWMFSDDGRQARCVRPKFTTELHELVFTVSNPRNPASASLQSVVKPWPMATTSVERISTYQTLHIEAIADFASSGANPPGTPPITALFHAVPWRNSAFATPGCEFDELVEEKVTTIYGMTAALLCAVDFDGNVPVYAHRIPAVKTRVVHNTSNHTWAFSATISNLNHGRYPQDPAQSIIDNNALYGYDAAGTVSETAQRRWTTTDTGHDGGYAFPWGEVVAQSAVARDYTETADLSRTWQRTFSYDPNSPKRSTSGGWSIFPSGDAYRYGGEHIQNSSIVGQDVAGFYGEVRDVLYLDLRQGWLAYQAVDDVTTSNTYSGTARLTVALQPQPAPYHMDGASTPPNYSWLGTTDGTQFLVVTDSGTSVTTSTTTVDGLPVTEFINNQQRAIAPLDVETIRVLLKNIVIAEQEVYRFQQSGTSTPSFSYYIGYGQLLRNYGVGSKRQIAGRTPAQYRGVDPTIREAVTTNSASSSSISWTYGASGFWDGGWQTYKGKYCFSMWRRANSVDWYLRGVGKELTGEADQNTLAQLTGAPTATNTYYPVTVLPPTQYKK